MFLVGVVVDVGKDMFVFVFWGDEVEVFGIVLVGEGVFFVYCMVLFIDLLLIYILLWFFKSFVYLLFNFVVIRY